MHYMNQHKLVWLAAGLATISCSRNKKMEHLPPIKIEAIGNLDVMLDQDVDWKFKATRGGQEIKVVDVSSPRIPFGVVPNYEPGNLGYRGKVKGRQFRSGLIKVTAFDTKSCERDYENMKKMVEKSVKETKSTDVSIPTNPCQQSISMSNPAMDAFVSHGYFYWHIIDGADAMTEQDYRSVVESMACTVAEDCREDTDAKNQQKSAQPKTKVKRFESEFLTMIPQKEAPHTYDALVGECARLSRDQCGSDKLCLWNRAACITATTMGHIALKEDAK